MNSIDQDWESFLNNDTGTNIEDEWSNFMENNIIEQKVDKCEIGSPVQIKDIPK